MIVDVDEPGRDDQASAVDDRITAPRRRAADGDDVRALDAHVGAAQRRARAVGHVGADDRPRARDIAAALLEGERARREREREDLSGTAMNDTRHTVVLSAMTDCFSFKAAR